MQLGYAMMITMFEVLQLVETIGKQFPHHHSTNSSRLKWLFRHHPFCYPQIFIFCCGDFPSKQLFYFWKLFKLDENLMRLFGQFSTSFSFSLQKLKSGRRPQKKLFLRLPSGYSFQAFVVLPLFVEKQWHFQLLKRCSVL